MKTFKLANLPDTGSLITAFLALLMFGNIMVFSASSVTAYREYQDSFYYLKKNALWMLMGFGILIFFAKYNYRNLRRFATPMMAVAIFLVLVVLIPGVGMEINGARRWIGVGPHPFQPSEFVKLSIAIYAATILSKMKSRENSGQFFIQTLAVTGVPVILILKQPDLGTAIIISCISLLLLFVSGSKFRHLAITVFSGFIALVVLIVSAKYRMKRILSFVDPWSDPRGVGFQIIQSLTAFGSGGVTGRGIGKSMQKYLYLPQAHTDFIYAIIGEEIGLAGTIAVILLFCIFGYFGFRIAYRAPDRFGKLLAGALTATIIMQALINIGAVTGVLPITGVTLPFISYGGTALMVNMASVGMLVNISSMRKIEVVNEVDDLRRGNCGPRISGNSAGRKTTRGRS